MRKFSLKKQLGALPERKDYILTLAVLAVACVLSGLLVNFDGSSYVQLIFVLAVAVISRFTNGYLCGLISSLLGMFAVNYAFTYPYFKLNFSITGYPVTFATMLLVTVIIGMLTSQLKEQSRVWAEMEKEKTRGNLLRAVSHDIRTPLTSISGAASAILENKDKLDEQGMMSLVTDIKEDAEWLIRMVENILTVTRISEETGTISKTPEAAEEIISEAVMKFRRRYDVPVEITIPDELMLIPMDAILIEQVIVNLLENSVLHGKTTTLIKLTLSSDGENAVFSVADNGSGINEKKLPMLFSGYFIHAEEQSGDVKRNMGIGLSVCLTIIKAHGGTMTAGNLPEGGAEFTFTLPLERTL